MNYFQILSIIPLVAGLSSGYPINTAHSNNHTASVSQAVDDQWALTESDDEVDARYLLTESLPDWANASMVISDNKILDVYVIDARLNPFYLQEDFNGDGTPDVAISVTHATSGKAGFAIIHGDSHDIHIVGAGKMIKSALSDDMSYIDVWKINYERENTGTDVDDKGDLIETPPLQLSAPSIKILKTEVGGGLIFWDGAAYAYLHQTC